MSKNGLVTKEVRRLIAKIGKSPEYVARKLNISVKSLNRWQKGDCAPSSLSLIRLFHLSEGHPLNLDSEDVLFLLDTSVLRRFESLPFRLIFCYNRITEKKSAVR